jgi:enoyl-CoA hydratase/carnithine racemase
MTLKETPLAAELQHISLERDDGLARVTLNRPPANALNLELIDELATVAGLLSDDETRVVILSSALPIFMAGADLINMVDSGWEELRGTIKRFQSAVNDWESIPGATIALINGHAAGGGCELTLACDWRIMARGRPRIGLPEGPKGLLPAGGGTQRMVRLLGRGRALDLCVRGRMIDADYAERIGLISEAVDADQLSARGDALAAELLELPQMTLRAIKRCILRGSDGDLVSGLQIEEDEMTALGETEDAREGVRAFVERRAPVFTHQ